MNFHDFSSVSSHLFCVVLGFVFFLKSPSSWNWVNTSKSQLLLKAPTPDGCRGKITASEDATSGDPAWTLHPFTLFLTLAILKQISVRGKGVGGSCRFWLFRTGRLEWCLSCFACCSRGLPLQSMGGNGKCYIFHLSTFPLFVLLSYLNELGQSFVSPPGNHR